MTRITWRYTACAKMNFLVHSFESYRLTDRDRQTYIQTDRTEIIYHAASRVVNNELHTCIATSAMYDVSDE